MSTVDAGVGDEGAADLRGGPAADPVSPNIPAAGIGVHGSPDSCDASATGRSSNTHFCAGPDACSSAAAVAAGGRADAAAAQVASEHSNGAAAALYAAAKEDVAKPSSAAPAPQGASPGGIHAGVAAGLGLVSCCGPGATDATTMTSDSAMGLSESRGFPPGTPSVKPLPVAAEGTAAGSGAATDAGTTSGAAHQLQPAPAGPLDVAAMKDEGKCGSHAVTPVTAVTATASAAAPPLQLQAAGNRGLEALAASLAAPLAPPGTASPRRPQGGDIGMTKLVDSLSPAEAAARQFAAQRDVIAMALSGEVSPAEVAEAKMELEEGGDLAPKCLTSAIFNIYPTRA